MFYIGYRNISELINDTVQGETFWALVHDDPPPIHAKMRGSRRKLSSHLQHPVPTQDAVRDASFPTTSPHYGIVQFGTAHRRLPVVPDWLKELTLAPFHWSESEGEVGEE